MLKKIVVLCLIGLLSCNQLAYAQNKSNDKVKVYPGYIDSSPFILGTPKQEIEVRNLLIECFVLMGYAPHTVLHNQSDYNAQHPQYDNVRECSRYAAGSIEDRFNNKKADMVDPVQQKEYDSHKKAKEVYKRLYLVIRQAGLIEVLKPMQPYDFSKEFSKSTGLMNYLNEVLKQNNFKVDHIDIEEAQVKFFGSEEKMRQVENTFYKKKMRQYNIGK